MASQYIKKGLLFEYLIFDFPTIFHKNRINQHTIVLILVSVSFGWPIWMAHGSWLIWMAHLDGTYILPSCAAQPLFIWARYVPTCLCTLHVNVKVFSSNEKRMTGICELF